MQVLVNISRKRLKHLHSNLILKTHCENFFRALQRNFHACVDAAQRSQEPNERNRFNEPDGVSPSTPDCRDFGYLLRKFSNKEIDSTYDLSRKVMSFLKIAREMANAIQSYSMVMARLSGNDTIFIFLLIFNIEMRRVIFGLMQKILRGLQVIRVLTLRRPLRRKLRMSSFFDVSKVKESSFFKSDLTDSPPSDF